MSVKIRLRRMGNNNKPFFRIIVADARSPAKGRFLENIGWYDPEGQKGLNFKLEQDRYDYWKSEGAQVSDTIKNLIKMKKNPPKVEAAPAPAKPEPAPEPEEAPAAAEEKTEEQPVAEEVAAEAAPEETPEAAEETPAAEEEVAKKDA